MAKTGLCCLSDMGSPMASRYECGGSLNPAGPAVLGFLPCIALLSSEWRSTGSCIHTLVVLGQQILWSRVSDPFGACLPYHPTPSWGMFGPQEHGRVSAVLSGVLVGA